MNNPELSSSITCRVLVVDDHPIMVEGCVNLLSRQRDMEICGSADNATDAMQLYREFSPTVAIIDISLQDSSGLDLIKQIVDYDEHAKILVISMYDESLYGERALKAGALGYLNKREATEKLVEAVRSVAKGDVFAGEALTKRLLSLAVGHRSNVDQSPVESLTDRELEVFKLVGEGLTLKKIASRLDLSPKTVSNYRDNIKAKLGLTNINELVRYATQWLLENN